MLLLVPQADSAAVLHIAAFTLGALFRPPCRRPSGLAGESVDDEASQRSDSLADDDAPGVQGGTG